MFQNLTEKLANAFKKFRNKGKLTEADVKEGIKETAKKMKEEEIPLLTISKITRSYAKTCINGANKYHIKGL